MIFVALVLVVLLGFSAFAVDLGAVYNERRQDQTAADAGALAGARLLGAASNSAVRDEVIELVNADISANADELTLIDFDSCDGDAGVLAIQSPSANCVSFDPPRSRVRVRLPDQIYKTALAKVIGLDDISHSAFAIAALRTEGFGGILPFGVPAGAGSGNGHECLKSGSNGTTEPPCDGPDAGNFGYLEFFLHGNADVGTRPDCNGGGQDILANNIAVGVDHRLSLFGGPPHGAVERNDADDCPGHRSPNAADTDTGNRAQTLGTGIYGGGAGDFSDGGPARLQRTSPSLSGGETRSIAGVELDDNPLWNFIQGGTLTDAPRSCQRDQFVSSSSGVVGDLLGVTDLATRAYLATFPLDERMTKLLERCFSHYNTGTWTDGSVTELRVGCTATCTGVIFGANAISNSESPDLFDMQHTARFAYAPQLTGPFPSGNQSERFVAFRALYIHRLVVNQPADCVFEPGVQDDDCVGFGMPSGSRSAGMSAFVFNPTMLPGDLGNPNAPNMVGVNMFVFLVR